MTLRAVSVHSNIKCYPRISFELRAIFRAGRASSGLGGTSQKRAAISVRFIKQSWRQKRALLSSAIVPSAATHSSHSSFQHHVCGVSTRCQMAHRQTGARTKCFDTEHPQLSIKPCVQWSCCTTPYEPDTSADAGGQRQRQQAQTRLQTRRLSYDDWSSAQLDQQAQGRQVA